MKMYCYDDHITYNNLIFRMVYTYDRLRHIFSKRGILIFKLKYKFRNCCLVINILISTVCEICDVEIFVENIVSSSPDYTS